MGWYAPQPGGTHTGVARPGGSLAAAPAPAGTHIRALRPTGSRWYAARPEGTVWRHALQPPLPAAREVFGALYSAEGTLSVSSIPVYVTGAGFGTEAVLSVATAQRYEVAAALATEGTLSAVVQLVGVDVPGPFTADATLSAQVFPRFGPHSAALAAEGILSAQVFPRHTQSAGLSADATLSAQVFPRHTQVASYSAEGTLSVTVQVIPARAAAFAAEGILAVVTFPRHAHSAALAAVGTLSVAVVQPTNASDDFNRADGAMGANWTTFALGTDTTVKPEIVSNAVRAKATTTNIQNNKCFAIYTATACLTDTMAVRGTMLANENALQFGPIVRASADGQNFVMGTITSDAAAYGIWTRIAGSLVRRGLTSTTAFNANDVFELQAVGNVYTLKQNPAGANTTIIAWTDTGNLFTPGPTRRYGGLWHQSARDGSSVQTWAPSVDDFNVRDL